MRKKTEVKNIWGYRIFIIQILSVIISLFLLTARLCGTDISWKVISAPVLISIIIPLISLVSIGLIMLIIFGSLYIFKSKDGKRKMIEGLRSIRWTRKG